MSHLFNIIAGTCAVVSAVAVVGGGLGWTLRHFVGITKRVSLFLNDYEGTPARPGVPARAGVMERLAATDTALTAVSETLASQNEVLESIRHQIYPNSGHSMFDKVNALWAESFPDRAAAGGPASP